ncbi:DMT family transporter [Streptomyces palmae]|uniref:Multidrug efflux SMR transporter n=1 Tax=Streptomyces palmae TaxID=1701085 RepID=A0A4Z0H884_9ACTN|nr:multidrug efflux SMR transporter [Streptomyces palmae]TGB12084.1 multidrug efflux SMR transporter [Streptomyces palmae]
MAWIYLLIASVFEVVFALATNATHGFTELGPSLLTAAAAAGGIFFLSLALRTLDVGVGYTVWTGIGSVGTVVLGTVIFDEAINGWKVLAFVLIIGGVLGLKLADTLAARQAPDQRPQPQNGPPSRPAPDRDALAA